MKVIVLLLSLLLLTGCTSERERQPRNNIVSDTQVHVHEKSEELQDSLNKLQEAANVPVISE